MTQIGKAYSSSTCPFRLSIINDELTPDFGRACEIAANDFGLQWIELRKVPGTDKEFAALTAPELKRYATQLDAARMKVLILYASALSAAATAAGQILGAKHVLQGDSAELASIRFRIGPMEDRELKLTLERLQRENFQGEVSLETTPEKAPDAMRGLMHFVGEL